MRIPVREKKSEIQTALEGGRVLLDAAVGKGEMRKGKRAFVTPRKGFFLLRRKRQGGGTRAATSDAPKRKLRIREKASSHPSCGGLFRDPEKGTAPTTDAERGAGFRKGRRGKRLA